VYGYPIEIQALFFMALRCALSMLKQDTADDKAYVERVVKRLHALSYHMRSYFWLDFQQLNNIYRPARMDFRWFALGNCVAILSSLATPEQSIAIMDLIEARWDELIGEMPLKISYPAFEGKDWEINTGFDHKNVEWSYHNGGSWPGFP
ncbi:alkaline/neutral invertase CINV2-like, partial [Trifolium medium]|nr:alkaline/neutral invertase CINV2-like [Trifolium medium]